MKNFVIIWKRRFEKTNWNTYFSSYVWERKQLENGMIEDVLLFKIPFQYWYGNQYEYESIAWLVERGYLPSNWSTLSRDERKTIANIIVDVTDVKRKKDL